MRKFTIILSILVLVVLLLPLVSATAQSNHIPHENPSTAGSTSNPILLLLFQGDVLEVALGGQYQDAQGLLDELRHANVPGDLQYIVDRFSVLSNDLLTDLDNLEGLLDEIAFSLELYQIDEVRLLFDSPGKRTVPGGLGDQGRVRKCGKHPQAAGDLLLRLNVRADGKIDAFGRAHW